MNWVTTDPHHADSLIISVIRTRIICCLSERLCLAALLLTLLSPASLYAAKENAQSNPYPSIGLSGEEQAWLTEHPVIRLGVDIEWPPFEYIDDQRIYRGMAADYIGLIEKRLGIRFEVEKDMTWAQVVEAVQGRELDMYSCVVETPQRREYMDFTRPYLDFPMVIVTADNVTYVDGIKDLTGKKIAVVKGYASHELLVANHPELELYLATDLPEALDAVSHGQVYAYIGNIASVSFMLRREGLTNLKISGKTPYRFELAMAGRKDWPELTSILQKALDTISEEEHEQIYNRWISLRYEHGFDTALLWQILGAGSLIIALILLWNRKLTIEVNRRNEAEHALADANQRLTLGLRGGDLGTWDWDLQNSTVKVNERWHTMLGYAPDKFEIDLEEWTSLVHPDDMDATYRIVEEHLSGLTDFYDAEFRMRTANGGIKWIRARGQIMERDPQGTPIRLAGVHQDITDLYLARQALEEANKELQDYVDIVDKYVITSSTDKHGVITSSSEFFCNISGYSREELIGRSHNIVRHPDMPRSLYDDLWQTIKSGTTWQGEIKNRRKDGESYWVHAYISPQFDDEGEISGFTAIRQDITDRKKIEAISITDELTGLYNRRHFNETFPVELARASRHNMTFALMIMDVDYFKKYNDSLGHQMGDRALMEIGVVLKNRLKRCDDLAFRLGGEEFGGIFVVSKIQDAYIIAEDIRNGIESLFIEHPMSEVSPYVTVSIGLYTVTSGEGKTPDMNEIYRLADEALYRAKAEGRNRVSKSQ